MKNKGYAKFGGQIKCIMGDVQVAYRFRLAKQQLRTCITLFCTFFLLSLHDYNVKVPYFTFCRGREHKTTTLFFFS